MSSQTPTIPQAFFERLEALLPAAESYQQVCAALQTGTPTSLRTNTLKTDADTLSAQLAADGFELEPVPWYKQAFILRNKTIGELTEHPLYDQGHLYIQGLSSMIPPIVLDPKPDQSILDLTAAPGSKTTQMAGMMENTGMILANDISTVRSYKLNANLDKQGVTNTKTWKSPGQKIWQKFPEQFDATLADVPCSMEGRVRFDRPKTFQNWSEKTIVQLGKRQRSLLRSALSATRVGGTLVYSTCTLAPEENESVVDWLLKKFPDSVQLEPISIPELATEPGITRWKGKQYANCLTQTARVYPSAQMEGFYIAKFKKIASSLQALQ